MSEIDFICLKESFYREKKNYEKKKKCRKSNSSGSALRRAFTERRKNMRNLFCVFMWADLPLG
jgi:hypothetical protein